MCKALELKGLRVYGSSLPTVQGSRTRPLRHASFVRGEEHELIGLSESHAAKAPRSLYAFNHVRALLSLRSLYSSNRGLNKIAQLSCDHKVAQRPTTAMMRSGVGARIWQVF